MLVHFTGKLLRQPISKRESTNFFLPISMINVFVTSSGIVCPYIVGLIISDENYDVLDRWAIVFYISGSSCILAGMIFIVFGSAEFQDWDECPDDFRPILSDTEQRDASVKAKEAS